MIDRILLALLLAAGIALLFSLASRLFRSSNHLGITGKLIWIDKGRETKPFFNNAFGVFGKPDFMYKIKGGVLAVEYKSRYGNIYQNDIAQAKTAALAARGAGYRVIRVLVKTKKLEKYFDLPSSDKALFNEVRHFVSIAKQARLGSSMKAQPNKYKCRGCAFVETCRHSLHKDFR